MDSDQESNECPLCLEVLEPDDLNFYPCTCCYQICRFCWHRIRTDENGLCPACRKPYSENPAQYKPLTEEEIQQVKRERKLKESHKKPKITESRKHLANLRVVQRNLVFVNGLPARLADTELLRRNDHFGRYGKIVKLVTSPAHNGQLNSICVYITYSRSEEALRAIQALHNYYVDGRAVKATLGTTKYCSRYLKGATCQKADCLYLHEPGDPLASFTKEQMQQGLHLDYERKLMEQFTIKNPSVASTTTPKTTRTLTNGHKNDASQRRKHPNQPTPLLPQNTTAMPSNGHSDLESGDENHHPPSNGYSAETFPSSTAINVDSDSTSTSSQTSSEHDPHIPPPTMSQAQNCQVSPNHRNWPDDRTCFYPTTDLTPSQSHTTKSVSSSMDVSLNVMRASPKLTNNSSSNEFMPNGLTNSMNNIVKPHDQMPEYKPFSTNIPSLHAMLFANLDNGQSNSTSNRPLFNGLGHDVREVEKKLLETSLKNADGSSFVLSQENDELGFDPCSLFISGLAHDIEDERQPSSSMISSRLHGNVFQNHSSQTSSIVQPVGQMNSNWFSQQQTQAYTQKYIDPQVPLHTNGATIQKPTVGPTTMHQQQQRYQLPFNGSSSRSMWNGNPQQQTQPQYLPQITTRVDVSNQSQAQRLPQTQASPSPQFSQSINSNHHKAAYPSNSVLSNNNASNESWPNSLYIDPAIISYGHKIDTPSSQWSSTTQSHGSSGIPSGNNLITTSRWSQSQPIQFQPHTLANSIYAPYSATSSVEDGNRS